MQPRLEEVRSIYKDLADTSRESSETPTFTAMMRATLHGELDVRPTVYDTHFFLIILRIV